MGHATQFLGEDQMTDRSTIEDSIRSAYAARIRGDLDGVMAVFAPDAVFEFNGRGTGLQALSTPCCGTEVLRGTIQALIDTFRIDDWKEISLLVDGEKALLHWKGRVTNTTTGKADVFDVFDSLTFRDGKIENFQQSTDTALIMSLAAL
jgi:ketosteroid isomerase-like protein